MSTPYVGEIKMFAGNFAPAGWMFCQGQLLPISEYETLFQLIGTTYGGDGQSTFALPNLASRFPIHMGSQGGTQYVIGQMAGTETVTLTTNQIPSHNHAPMAASNGVLNSPANNWWSNWPGAQYSDNLTGLSAMNSNAMVGSGNSQPHDNLPPYLAINFIISLFGIFPSQT